MTKKTILKAGLIAALGMTSGTANGQNNQSFEEFRKAKIEQFNKFTKQKKQEFSDFTPNTQNVGGQQNAQKEEAKKVGNDWAQYYQLVVVQNLKLDEASLKCQTVNDNKMGVYASDNGIAILTQQGYGSCGILENGKLNYYLYNDGQKIKCDVNKDKEVKEFLDMSFQQYGNPNSSFSKALKTSNLKEQSHQRLQQRTPRLEEGWHKTQNPGIVYSFTDGFQMKIADQNMDVSHLLPSPKQNPKDGKWYFGAVQVKDFKNQAEQVQNFNFAQQVALSQLHVLSAQSFVYKDLQERSKTEKLGENEKTFMANHIEGLQGMGLHYGKNGKLEKTNTLNLTSHFMQNSGNASR